MSGFRKNDLGKPRMSLVPSEAVRGAAVVMTHGAEKYDDHNWRKPTYWTRFWDAADRHMRAWLEGEDLDESGLPTIDHALSELMMLSATIKRGVGTDDRYKHDNKTADEIVERELLGLPIPKEVEEQRGRPASDPAVHLPSSQHEEKGNEPRRPKWCSCRLKRTAVSSYGQPVCPDCGERRRKGDEP